MKKVFILLLCFLMIFNGSVSFASGEALKFKAEICCNFDPDYHISDYITIKPFYDIEYGNLKIPAGTILKAKVNTTTTERRFHKSAFLIVNFEEIKEGDCFKSITGYNIGGVIRKYEKIDKKDATITGAELTTTTVAAFIIPGIDILYYFTKGCIQNTKAETRFKSGVHNAYDNSIMWFFLKGKPIKLVEGDSVAVLMCDNDMITVKKNKSVKIKNK